MTINQLSVAFLATSLTSRAGGIAAALSGSVNAVTRLGVNAEVFGLLEGGLDVSALSYEKARVRTVASLNFKWMRFSPELDRALAESAADILHLHGLWQYSSIASLRWRSSKKRPLVVSPHGMLDTWALRNSAWKKRLALFAFERRNLEGASCIHVLSEAELDSVRSFGLRNPVAVIANGIDLPSVDQIYERPAFLVGETRRILLSLGRIHPKKGHIETIRAWGEALRRDPTLEKKWILVIAGWDDGGYLDQLRMEAVLSNAGQSVVFPGPVFGDIKAGLFQCADAFILASHSEGMPMSILEAWSYGLPVLMTTACNLPDGFSNGAAMRISTDPHILAGELLRFLADPDLKKMGKAGKTLVAQQYNWSRSGEEFLAVYNWLADNGSRPACVV